MAAPWDEMSDSPSASGTGLGHHMNEAERQKRITGFTATGPDLMHMVSARRRPRDGPVSSNAVFVMSAFCYTISGSVIMSITE